jgi:hypothetical protein
MNKRQSSGGASTRKSLLERKIETPNLMLIRQRSDKTIEKVSE